MHPDRYSPKPIGITLITEDAGAQRTETYGCTNSAPDVVRFNQITILCIYTSEVHTFHTKSQRLTTTNLNVKSYNPI